MKIRRSCREVTRIVLEGEDRRWTPMEQLSLRLHWLACDGCRRFRKQAATLHVAVDRWRRYRDEA